IHPFVSVRKAAFSHQNGHCGCAALSRGPACDLIKMTPHASEAMTASHMNRDRLEHLQAVIRADIKAGLYHGAVIKIARGGAIALDVAIGAEDAAQSKPLASN